MSVISSERTRLHPTRMHSVRMHDSVAMVHGISRWDRARRTPGIVWCDHEHTDQFGKEAPISMTYHLYDSDLGAYDVWECDACGTVLTNAGTPTYNIRLAKRC